MLNCPLVISIGALTLVVVGKGQGSSAPKPMGFRAGSRDQVVEEPEAVLGGKDLRVQSRWRHRKLGFL